MKDIKKTTILQGNIEMVWKKKFKLRNHIFSNFVYRQRVIIYLQMLELLSNKRRLVLYDFTALDVGPSRAFYCRSQQTEVG